MNNVATSKALTRQEAPDFVTYSRQFEKYKWFKPILEILLTGVFWYAGTALCAFIAIFIVGATSGDIDAFTETIRGGYDTFDTYTLPGVIYTLGGISCIIPSAFLANKIVRARPFHSILSSCGGFNFKIFAKVLCSALVIIGIPVAIDTLIDVGERSAIEFTVIGFIACLIIAPLQCVGEEIMFRGLFLQAIGSWIRKPLVAVIVQTLIFALAHPYGILGVIEVFLSGLLMGVMAYYTKGIETSSACHIVNNMVLFIMNGFGFKNISTNGSSVQDIIMVVIIESLYIAFIIYMDKKYNWLCRTPKKSDADQIVTDDNADNYVEVRGKEIS